MTDFQKNMAKLFVELSLEAKKKAYKEAKDLLEIKVAFDKIVTKKLNEKEQKLWGEMQKEKETFNKVMEALIEWHEIIEKIEIMEKEMKEGKDNE